MELFLSTLICIIPTLLYSRIPNLGQPDADTDAVNATVKRRYEWKYQGVTVLANLKWVEKFLHTYNGQANIHVNIHVSESLLSPMFFC